MSGHLGDFIEDATVYMTWGSYDGGTGASITQTGLVAADVIIFKDGSATQKTSTNGITINNDFDTRTGLHLISIDTSNDTGDAGFWVAQADYQVAIDAVTIDGQTVRFWVGSFSIENRAADVRRWIGTPSATPTVAGVPEVDLTHMEGGTQTVTDLKDFADAGYDPATNKVQGVVLADTLTTLTGHTAQTGDSFARLGAPAGASMAADLVVIDNFVDDLESRLTAARATNLDELGSTNIPADIDTLLTRLTAARAALLDEITAIRLAELDAANLPATTDNIKTETDKIALTDAGAGVAGSVIEEIEDIPTTAMRGTDGVDTAAMRGTDSAALASVATEARLAELDAANLPSDIDDIQGAGFVTGTDSLEAIRDRGDAAWTTGAGGSDRLLLVDTTIATLASQTSFTLTAGSADDDAYNNATIVIEDAATSTQKAIGLISDYVGSTKTVTLKYDPAIFTIAATDKVYILAENALKADAANRQLNVAANGDIGGDVAGSVGSVDGHTAQTGDNFARLGAPAGASVSADMAAVKTEADKIALADAGAGVAGSVIEEVENIDQAAMRGTDGANTVTPLTAAQVNAEVDQALVDVNLDHVAGLGAGVPAIPSSTYIDQLMDDGTATFDRTTDSLQAIRDRGDAAWIPAGVSKNAAFNDFEFLMVDSADGVTPKTGLTVTGQRSIDGGGFASVSGTIAEVANGIYQFDALAADTNGDLITWRFSSAGANDTFVTFKTI